MRDPARIDLLLDRLGKLWNKQPDLRLGQLLVILQSKYSKVEDLFYLEDSELINIITNINENGWK